MGLITEGNCKFKKSSFDGVMKMEAKLRRGDWKIRK